MMLLAVRERSKGLEYFKVRALLLAQKGVPSWLSLDIKELFRRRDHNHTLTCRNSELPFR